MYDIVVRYEDGRRTAVEHGIGDLGEACSLVLKLADSLGSKPEEGAATARSVDIFHEDRLEISVSVVRGGLRPKRGR